MYKINKFKINKFKINKFKINKFKKKNIIDIFAFIYN